MRNMFGVRLKRTSKVRKARDPETEEKARQKRVRKAEVIRANRELGAFDSFREPRGARGRAWPGGRERRESEMARIAARAAQEAPAQEASD